MRAVAVVWSRLGSFGSLRSLRMTAFEVGGVLSPSVGCALRASLDDSFGKSGVLSKRLMFAQDDGLGGELKAGADARDVHLSGHEAAAKMGHPVLVMLHEPNLVRDIHGILERGGRALLVQRHRWTHTRNRSTETVPVETQSP
jgi:hypothetical protein